ELVGDRGRHLPERCEAAAATDLELRLPQALVGPLQLAVLVGQVAGGLSDARLEARGQLLDARQHAVETAGDEAELPAPCRLHPAPELTALRPLHARHQPGHWTTDASFEDEGEGERAEDRRADQE